MVAVHGVVVRMWVAVLVVWLAGCGVAVETDPVADVAFITRSPAERPPAISIEPPRPVVTARDLQRQFAAEAGDRVFFATGRWDLSAEAKVTLKRQAAWLLARPGLTVTLEGHADQRGSLALNERLSQQRAAAVDRHLVSLGVAPKHITILPLSKQRPAAHATSPDALRANRRVVTVIDQPPPGFRLPAPAVAGPVPGRAVRP